MILADKIIRLRKKNGWSQEELAEKMNVSRQAVSKWEGAQTVPDLGKILQLSELFGVTTDYLLKDDMDAEEFTDDSSDAFTRHVTLQEANTFMDWRKKASLWIAFATFLCIIAVIPLLILGAATEVPAYGISETLAAGVGLVALFVIVAIAVSIFVYCGFKNSPYEFLDKESFETEYGVKGMVKEKQKTYRNTYIISNIVGTCLCVLSPIPLFIGAFTGNDFYTVVALTFTIFLAGIGVIFFVTAGVRWASMQKLLQEGEFTPVEKSNSKAKESIGGIYWLLATAIYLGWSFITNDWHITWIVWPVAGVLFAVVMAVCNLVMKQERP